jgi:3-oxoacyl-[acyl-carrier protein] reductase
MDKKIALVTGGSSEIGRAVIIKLLENNVRVYAQFNENKLEIKSDELIEIKCSFLEEEEIHNLVKGILEIESKIDLLVNAAGVIENSSFLECSSSKIKDIFQINFFSHVQLMQKIFPIMCQNKFGRIISLSSIGVKFGGSPNSVFYSSSKTSLEAVTRSYAKFGASSNVLCNNIRVGVIDTSIHKNKYMTEIVKLIPMRKLGKAEDIAEMVLFLCSEKSNFITGQDISVSGGE